jgi:uncharacterized protein (DUF1919 family)
MNYFDAGKQRIHEIFLPITSRLRRKHLENFDFSIIASNCIGTRMYRELGIEYTSPFVGLFIFAPDYIKLLKNLKYYLSLPMEFIDKSKYTGSNSTQVSHEYLIGLLGGDIEFHLLYDNDKRKAREKWDRRLERINWDNLFFTFTDRDLCTDQLIHEFDSLPFKHKICFTAKKISNLSSSVWVKDYKDQPFVGDMYTNCSILEKNFNFVEWLNSKD